MIATLAAADPYLFTRRGQGWGGGDGKWSDKVRCKSLDNDLSILMLYI